MSRAYYNEIDPYAAQWIRNLIASGHVSPGDVDQRDIRDVLPSDLAGYTRCHFFAGIAVWDYALSLAGWPADRPVWTGSCPCQPFSAAGRGGRVSDERHLWPAFFHLIEMVRPAIVLGEQVASKDGLAWLDLVHADLEGADYDVAAADLCAAGVGAPHIRQRLWFMAHADRERREQHACLRQDAGGWNAAAYPEAPRRGEAGSPVAESAEPGPQGRLAAGQRPDAQRAAAERGGAVGFVGDTTSGEQRRLRQPGPSFRRELPAGRPSPWRDADWLPCRDGKARPVEPGTFPLAHGAPARVGRLRAYGNAINAEAAAAFIAAALDVLTPPSQPGL